MAGLDTKNDVILIMLATTQIKCHKIALSPFEQEKAIKK